MKQELKDVIKKEKNMKIGKRKYRVIEFTEEGTKKVRYKWIGLEIS